VADAVSRYLLPVEWAGYLMAAVSLDAVLCGFQWLWKSVRAPKIELISGIGNPTNGG
jgi:hypothetical protein